MTILQSEIEKKTNAELLNLLMHYSGAKMLADIHMEKQEFFDCKRICEQLEREILKRMV